MEVVDPFIKKESNYIKIESVLNSEDEIDKLKVLDIWGAARLKQHGKEFYGSHPIHGSDGGSNFWINPEQNTWHCFRCDSGGGALSAIAVKEGIIDCADAQPGSLRGEKAKQAIKIAKEKYGLKDKQNYSYQEPPPTEAYEKEWVEEKIITPVNEILKMKEIEDPFLIDKIIVENSINALTSDSGKGKSIIMLKMVEAIVRGEKFLGEFNVKKTKTLILDLEMSRNDLIQRSHSIIQNEIDGLDFFFLQSFNIEKDFQWLEKQIKEKKYGLIVFDTLSAIHEREENSNTDMEPILKKFLELTNKIKITVLFLHHHRKTQKGEIYSQLSSRGAGKIIEKAACHLLLDSRDIKVIDKDTGADMNGLNISIEQHKRRQLKGLDKFGVKIYNNPFTKFTTFDWGGYIENTITKEDKAKELIIEFLKKNSMATMTMIKEMINKNEDIGIENIRNACKSLVEIGKIVFTQGEGKNHATKYYSIPEKTEKLWIKY